MITNATHPASRKVEKMIVAMSLSIESMGASGRTVRPPAPGSWIDVSGGGEGGPSSIPLSFTFFNVVGGGGGRSEDREEKIEKTCTCLVISLKTSSQKSQVSHSNTDLLYFLAGGGWDDIALIAREAVGELLQDLGFSFRGRLMMTLKCIIKRH